MSPAPFFNGGNGMKIADMRDREPVNELFSWSIPQFIPLST